jgi:hypothetical protein
MKVHTEGSSSPPPESLVAKLTPEEQLAISVYKANHFLDGSVNRFALRVGLIGKSTELRTAKSPRRLFEFMGSKVNHFYNRQLRPPLHFVGGGPTFVNNQSDNLIPVVSPKSIKLNYLANVSSQLPPSGSNSNPPQSQRRREYQCSKERDRIAEDANKVPPYRRRNARIAAALLFIFGCFGISAAAYIDDKWGGNILAGIVDCFLLFSGSIFIFAAIYGVDYWR